VGAVLVVECSSDNRKVSVDTRDDKEGAFVAVLDRCKKLEDAF
jgi:hypothetical protein